LLVFLTLFFFYLLNFYRATRMHSADYTVARCLSVRLSVRMHRGMKKITIFHEQLALSRK